MSEGETPEILEACPIVLGFIFLSFSLPSLEIDLIFSKLKSGWIFIYSSLLNFSTFSFSFSM
jgi:hypothetical protein